MGLVLADKGELSAPRSYSSGRAKPMVNRMKFIKFIFLICLVMVVGPGRVHGHRKKKPARPGAVEIMFSDVTVETRLRQVSDPDMYMEQLGDLKDRSEDELNVALRDLEVKRRIDSRNWQEIERARRRSQLRLPLEGPIHVARL